MTVERSHSTNNLVSPEATRRWVLIALTLLLALRLFYAFVYIESPRPFAAIGGDARDFLELAWSLKETGHYGTLSHHGQIDVATALVHGEAPSLPAVTHVEPNGWRPPLWTAVLALLLVLTGDSLTGVLLLRFLLDGVTLLLFAALVRRAALPNWAFALSLILFALHPTWLLYSNTLLSEPLSLLLLVALALALVRFLEKQSLSRAMAVGLSAALATLCHPLFLFAAIGSVAYLVWTARPWTHKVNPKSKGLQFAAVATISFALPVAAWVARNAVVLGEVSVTTSSGNVVAMGWSKEFLETYNNATAEIHVPAGPGALTFLKEDWALAPAIVSRKIIGALGPRVETKRPGILELGRSLWWTAAFLPVWLCLLGGRLLPGLLAGPLAVALRIQIAGYLLMTVATYPAIRFRTPIIWIDVVAVVATLALLLRWSKHRIRARPHQP